MTGLHEGSCLCGAVTFNVTGAFEAFFLCHCSLMPLQGTFSYLARVHWGLGRWAWYPFIDQKWSQSYKGAQEHLMPQIGHYDPLERQHAKDRARERDEHALRSGEVSREDLRLRNSLLAPLDIMSSSIELPDPHS